MPAKQERIRIDIWSSLRPVIEAEMSRSGLSAQEVVNIALVDYFGLTPNGKGKIQPMETRETTREPKINEFSEDDDYI